MSDATADTIETPTKNLGLVKAVGISGSSAVCC